MTVSFDIIKEKIILGGAMSVTDDTILPSPFLPAITLAE